MAEAEWTKGEQPEVVLAFPAVNGRASKKRHPTPDYLRLAR
jgi:hypothetical protein